MAITKINTPEIFDLGTTNSSLRLPSGDTASRPSNPNTGEWRYNTDDNYVEYWDGSAWFQIDYETAVVPCTTDTINYPSGTTNTAYYKMSDATDSTLNGYNGTATNVNFNVAGKFGNAGSFNGSSSYITIPNIKSQLDGGVSFTISCWVNVSSSQSGEAMIINTAGSSSVQGVNIGVQPTSGLVYFQIKGNNNLVASGTTNLVGAGWKNIVLTHTTSSTILYVNGGTPEASVGANTIGTMPNDLTLGKWAASSLYYLNGSIDQVRIFSSALTAANVTSLYNEVQCVPAIIPSDYFEPVIYTGNGGTQSITSLDFEPDLVWIKQRSSPSRDHVLNDSVRGANKILYSNLTNAEDTAGGSGSAYFNSFDSNGFTVGSSHYYNGSSLDYVAWNWKSGDAPTATNSAGAGNVPTAGSVKIDGADSTTALAGTIAATSISANTDAGFSIVKYTGNGGNATLGTGLDQQVEMVICKSTESVSQWMIYHKDLTGNVSGDNPYNLYFSTSNELDLTAFGAYNSFTSSVFPVTRQSASTAHNNNNNIDYIAYCFASIPGMSDIGSYIGTGASGNTIVTGFRPAFVMIKQSSNVGTDNHWNMWDNKRVEYDMLRADTSDSEFAGTLTRINFLSNGFEMMDSDTSRNANGSSYIYLAIAEQVYNANAVTANQTNPFNDGSQIAQYEFEDNADDSQPNGYIGKGGTFNGSSSNIIAPSFMPTGSSSRSVSAWVKTTVSNTNMTILKYGANSTNSAFIFRILNGQLGIAFYGNDHDFTATGLTDGNWHHVAGTYDGSNARVYLDGSLIGTGVTTAPNTTSTVVGIGAYDNGVDGLFNGSIDQVRIYNTALNPNDVWLLYSETSATSSTLDYPASTGAIALYELEGDATSTSSSTYDGAATAVAWVPLYDGTENTMTYAAPSVSAPFLKAGVFNGSSSGISIPDSITNTQDVSVSLWVKDIATPASGYSLLYVKYGQDYFYITVQTSGELGIYIDNYQDPNYPRFITLLLTTGINLNDGNWHHIAVINKIDTSANGGGYFVYVNGVLNASASFSSSMRRNSGDSLSAGIGYYPDGSYFTNGKIDQVRIFNKAIDAGEVLQLYNEPNN